MLFLYR